MVLRDPASTQRDLSRSKSYRNFMRICRSSPTRSRRTSKAHTDHSRLVARSLGSNSCVVLRWLNSRAGSACMPLPRGYHLSKKERTGLQMTNQMSVRCSRRWTLPSLCGTSWVSLKKPINMSSSDMICITDFFQQTLSNQIKLKIKSLII